MAAAQQDGAGSAEAVDIVDRAFAAALHVDGDTALDTGASLLAAGERAPTEAALTRRGEEFVSRAWQRGWLPADLVRHVRRQLAGPHVRLVETLISGETRRYEGLDGRWTAQLAALGTAAAPGAESGPAADRFTRATVTLELFRLLLRLPAIEPLGPPPGTPPSLLSTVHVSDSRALGRIRGLLAKAEATDYPAEAEALTAKAQELMARHSVDDAHLGEAAQAQAPGAIRIGVEAPYETAKAILLDAVARANRCRSVWNEELGFSTVVGFERDLEVVELLHTSLLIQGTAAMTGAEAGQRAAGRRRTKTFRQSFLLAYAHRLGDRLTATTARVTEETADAETLPVLAARDVAVTDEAERMFPRTRATRVRGASDHDGWHAGTAAAEAARWTRGRLQK
ncbi:DUF2786 domain-containing protein [Streptomyces tsukubensis]|uniref:Aromatic acid decarboxylase n=1 Tax=Streptomyces tsukubensis TaxID=83656 RepID=A0A1V4A460_9ACTN|nr:DUF2786 domain-containing protein [Streptomyces tsukubensis]OON75354.1 aromatic acid decarboxylase [Streptomyces tsukubensis]QFR95016.1 DUF2786 domain-containing protein [Streptomyces tsukubensis]